MAHNLKQLGQLRPSEITAVSLYSPPVGDNVVHSIIVCNTSDSEATYSIFVDDNGEVYNETTAIFWEAALPANTSDVLEVKICMNDETGSLGVKTGSINALTFTAFGEEIS